MATEHFNLKLKYEYLEARKNARLDSSIQSIIEITKVYRTNQFIRGKDVNYVPPKLRIK